MDLLIRLKPREFDNRIWKNPHLWIILFIFLVIVFLYYFAFGGAYSIYSPGKGFLWLNQLGLFEYSHSLNGSLFFIPFIYATVIFWWRGALAVWILAIAVMLPRIIYLSYNPTLLLTNIIFASVPLLLVFLITLQVNWIAREKRTLQDREIERQAYISQIFRAQEEERHRLAQELHDDTTQTLLVIANKAHSLLSNGSQEDIADMKKQINWMHRMLIRVSDEVRRISLGLWPSVLDNLGLIPALRWLIEESNKQGNPNTDLQIKGDSRKLPHEMELVIFRIVQEALNNARRHSGATRATVLMQFSDSHLNLIISDNGSGFPMPASEVGFADKGKLGIIGMHQKCKLLGGDFNISSKPGSGTKVSVHVKA